MVNAFLFFLLEYMLTYCLIFQSGLSVWILVLPVTDH